MTNAFDQIYFVMYHFFWAWVW